MFYNLFTTLTILSNNNANEFGRTPSLILVKFQNFVQFYEFREKRNSDKFSRCKGHSEVAKIYHVFPLSFKAQEQREDGPRKA